MEERLPANHSFISISKSDSKNASIVLQFIGQQSDMSLNLAKIKL